MQAKDVMTRDVISIGPDATVLQAARMMFQHHISGLPVVDAAGELVGVLSEGDFFRRRKPHRAAAVTLARFLMGAGTIAVRIHPFARPEGFRSHDRRGRSVAEDAALEASLA